MTQQNASNSKTKPPPPPSSPRTTTSQLLCLCPSKRQIVIIKTTAKTWCVLQSKGRWTIKRVPLTLDGEGEGSLSLSLSQIFLFLSFFFFGISFTLWGNKILVLLGIAVHAFHSLESPSLLLHMQATHNQHKLISGQQNYLAN